MRKLSNLVSFVSSQSITSSSVVTPSCNAANAQKILSTEPVSKQLTIGRHLVVSISNSLTLFGSKCGYETTAKISPVIGSIASAPASVEAQFATVSSNNV